MITELLNKLKEMEQNALIEIQAAKELKDIQPIRVHFTGKKGLLADITKEMRHLSKDEKPQLGQGISTFQQAFNEAIEAKEEDLKALALKQQLEEETLDITLPGRTYQVGARHLLTQTREEIEDIFLGMGYQIIEGPEVELDYYNFEKMNIPPNHPARDMQDTFYIDEHVLLRTHTSPVQARTMEVHNFAEGPLRMISPGKVFRRDADDATHSHQFMQIEGLVVDKKVTLADLKGTLLELAEALFGKGREIRLRPSYFPFTEPSVEIDVSCFKCDGKGCNVCKQSGWIEILGAGLVHPDVLTMSGIDASEYSGFAFGLGVERVAMLKHNVDDIRHFYQNDVRFLTQFLEGDK